MSDQWTYFLTSLPPLGQKRSALCNYCYRPESEHDAMDHHRCPIPNCALQGPPSPQTPGEAGSAREAIYRRALENILKRCFDDSEYGRYIHAVFRAAGAEPLL
jgi:hypothetical protein